MKIFHTENGKEVVYVQMQDIMYVMNEINIPVPGKIITQCFEKGMTIVDDSNRYNFIRFDEKYVVRFFKKLGFIIDYEQYKDMTSKEIEEEMLKLIRIKENTRWNVMSKTLQKANQKNLERFYNITYILDNLEQIYTIKRGEMPAPFPEFMKDP